MDDALVELPEGPGPLRALIETELGTGTGGPGYKFNDEIAGLTHVPGTLAYANSGANTNGSQFYITEGAEPDLDADYVIFGVCEPISVVQAITAVPTVNDKPVDDLHTISVTITRCAP
jgi:peptidyl-prolyl cis-trans isomerase A (cyclophilin A)